jgi:hypothetical protein
VERAVVHGLLGAEVPRVGELRRVGVVEHDGEAGAGG